MAAEQRVIVVGGGLAGLAASVRIAESGVPVDLFSMVPVKRSHSVCAQGGINACNEVARQQGYSEYQHFDETIYGGDFLADQHPVLEMANWAPKIIDLLDRMGSIPCDLGIGVRGGRLDRLLHFLASADTKSVQRGPETGRKAVPEGLAGLSDPDPGLPALPDDVQELLAVAAAPEADVLLGRGVVRQQEDGLAGLHGPHALPEPDHRQRAQEPAGVLDDLGGLGHAVSGAGSAAGPGRGFDRLRPLWIRWRVASGRRIRGSPTRRNLPPE